MFSLQHRNLKTITKWSMTKNYATQQIEVFWNSPDGEYSIFHPEFNAVFHFSKLARYHLHYLRLDAAACRKA
jgi:hypothetical protein